MICTRTGQSHVEHALLWEARRAMAATLDAITGTVDETAVLVLCLHHRRVKIVSDKVLCLRFVCFKVRGVGDTTAATLGATLRLTGALTRGLGQAVQTPLELSLHL